MQDELFSPTIQEQPGSGKPPWRPDSIVYPAVIGGPLAAATLGVLNGERLGLPGRRLLIIGAAGLAGFCARLAVAAAFDGNSPVRLAAMVGGALVWLLVLHFQRAPFRAYTYRGGEPANLIGPGFAAAAGLGLLEAILILALVR